MEPAERSLLSPEAPAIPEPLVLPPPAAPGQRVWVHVLLFLLTVVSTVWAGGPLLGGTIGEGVMFSAALLSILLAHEFGHYFTARSYGVPVSLPYFIPFPISPFGTLGAVIRMSPRIPHRRALFDIAAAGPLAGLVLALPLTYAGILFSTFIRRDQIPRGAWTLSEPYLFQALTWLSGVHPGSNFEMVLNPLAFAGWAGMFVTALNLLPIGQLDGGHVIYSLFGSRSGLMARLMYFGLFLHTILRHNTSWILLLVLLFFIGIQHPPSGDDGRPIGRTRQVIGLLLAAIFITCFSLVPMH